MIADIAKYAALLLVVLVATVGVTRIVVAENETGRGSSGPALRSARVKQLDMYLLGSLVLMALALSVYFFSGLQ